MADNLDIRGACAQLLAKLNNPRRRAGRPQGRRHDRLVAVWLPHELLEAVYVGARLTGESVGTVLRSGLTQRLAVVAASAAKVINDPMTDEARKLRLVVFVRQFVDANFALFEPIERVKARRAAMPPGPRAFRRRTRETRESDANGVRRKPKRHSSADCLARIRRRDGRVVRTLESFYQIEPTIAQI